MICAAGSKCFQKTALCVRQTPLKQLSDRHRQGAMLVARGVTFRQISQEFGWTAGYWGQLARWEPLFRELVEQYRQTLEDARTAALAKEGAARARRQPKRKNRPKTPLVSRIIIERRA